MNHRCPYCERSLHGRLLLSRRFANGRAALACVHCHRAIAVRDDPSVRLFGWLGTLAMVVGQGSRVPWLATPLAIATVVALVFWLRGYRRARREFLKVRRYIPAFETLPASSSGP